MKKQLILLVMILLPMVASAYDFALENSDGVTIYYNYILNGKETEDLEHNDAHGNGSANDGCLWW